MVELLRDRKRRLTATLTVSMLGGCFAVPDASPPPHPVPSDLSERVSTALAGHEDAALKYAGLYAVLADRFEAGAYETTSEAAAVAGRAADVVGLPGVLKEVVDDELNPLLGTPQAVTPELAVEAAARLRALSAACREVAR